MTQSDFDFIGQIVEDRLVDPAEQLHARAVLANWYSLLLGVAVLAGAVIGFAG